MRFKSFVVLLFATLLAVSAYADVKRDASEFVDEIGRNALAVMEDGEKTKEEKTTELESLFEKTVDIDAIGKFVLGRNWRIATEEQKKNYLETYRTFLIKHYTSNLSEFSNVNFKVTKVLPEDSGGSVVTMRITRPKAEDIVVDYTIRKKADDGLKVYDITIEGVSMITTQRSEFSSVVEQKGIDYLIAQLAEKSKKEEKTIN